MDAQVTFHNVQADAFARVRDRVLGLHEGTLVDGTPEAIHSRGVRAQVEFDGDAGDLHVRIDAVPAIVTRGHVIGWLHDALVAAESEPVPETAPTERSAS